jgi:hypothetical protein
MSHVADADVIPQRPSELLWMPIWLAAGLHLLAWLTLGYWLYYRVPAFGELMQNMDVELTELTVLIVNLSNLVVNWWFILLPSAVLLALADAYIDWMLVRAARSFARTAWFVAGFAIPAGLLVVAVVAVDVLFLGLMQELS